MKKISIFLALAMLVCLLTACGDGSPSAPSGAVNQNEMSQTNETQTNETQTNILYCAFYGTDDEHVREYPIEYTGAPKSPEELADALTELSGICFDVTVNQIEEGLTVDWAASSTLFSVESPDEKSEEFHFFDYDSCAWFMMDSLWLTLTENFGAENIYYTMDGGQELVLDKLSSSITEFPSDVPYMGSDFYEAHADVRGEDDLSVYARTEGLWRLDGSLDSASIYMDGLGGFTMYYASGSTEAVGRLECIDEYGDGEYRYDMYDENGEWITGFYFDSDIQIHMGNDDDKVYMRDMHDAMLGFWQYPEEMNGWILYISDDGWELSDAAGNLMDQGPVEFDATAVFLMNEDGSSGGGMARFNENGELRETGYLLTYIGPVAQG